MRRGSAAKASKVCEAAWNSDHTVGGVRPKRRFCMRRCLGTPCAGGRRAYRPTAKGTPVRIDERPRRLPAEVPSTLSAVILGAIDGLQLKRIKRTANRLESLQRHVQVPGRGADIGMAEQNLDGAEIGSGIQHVRGARVTEQMRKD